MPFTDHHTRTCLACRERAQHFGGHVHQGGRLVTAGWCLAHSKGDSKRKGRPRCSGCYATWRKRDGIAAEVLYP
jgi:hypothetical protein